MKGKTSQFQDSLFGQPLDEFTLIVFLYSTTNEGRQLISCFYKKLYLSIQKYINNQLKFRLKQISNDMFDISCEYDARELKTSFSSFTNDTSIIIGIFSLRLVII